jgi:ferredoxin
MRAAVEGRIQPDDPAFQLHIDRCLGCRACEPVCPSGVPYGFLLERARTAIARSAGVSPSTRLLIASFTGPARGLVTALSRLTRRTGLARLLARVLPRALALPRFGMAMLAGSAPWAGLRSAPAIRGRTEVEAGLTAHPAVHDCRRPAPGAGPVPADDALGAPRPGATPRGAAGRVRAGGHLCPGEPGHGAGAGGQRLHAGARAGAALLWRAGRARRPPGAGAGAGSREHRRVRGVRRRRVRGERGGLRRHDEGIRRAAAP